MRAPQRRHVLCETGGRHMASASNSTATHYVKPVVVHECPCRRAAQTVSSSSRQPPKHYSLRAGSRPNTIFVEPSAAPMLCSSSRQPPAHCFRRTDGRPNAVFVEPAAAQSVFSSCRRPPQYYFRRADSRPDTISVELAAAPTHR